MGWFRDWRIRCILSEISHQENLLTIARADCRRAEVFGADEVADLCRKRADAALNRQQALGEKLKSIGGNA